MANTKADEKAADKKAAAKADDEQKNVVHGAVKPPDVFEQAKKARGQEDEDGKEARAMREYSDGRDKQAEKILEEAYPERKAIDLRIESRREFNEKFGIDPNRPGSQLKVEKGDVKEKLYDGNVTLHSIHGETHEKLSFPFEIRGYPRGESYLWYVMQNAHPHAMREHFEIDPENKTDPMLRSRFE